MKWEVLKKNLKKSERALRKVQESPFVHEDPRDHVFNEGLLNGLRGVLKLMEKLEASKRGGRRA